MEEKKQTTFESGFLLLYNNIDMVFRLSDENIGKLIKACVYRQRDKVPFPEVENDGLAVAQYAYEGIIQWRECGREGGKKATESKRQKAEKKA